MRSILLTKSAIKDFEYWGINDPKMLKRIALLFYSISKTPFEGIGKPELLKSDLRGFWSRRITDEHRLVYEIDSEKIIVISCRSHYNF